MLVPSLTTIITSIFLIYILHSIWLMAELFIPPTCDPKEQCVHSSLETKNDLMMFGFISEKASHISAYAEPIWKERFFHHDSSEWTKTIFLSDHVRNNGSLFLHVIVLPAKHENVVFKDIAGDSDASSLRVRLTQAHTRAAETYKLLDSEEKHYNTGESKAETLMDKKQKVNHIKKKITVNMLASADPLPRNRIPPEMIHLFSYNTRGDYLPPLQYNFLRARILDLEEVKSNTKSVNVTLTYLPISFGKSRFLIHLDLSLRYLKNMGISDKDLDEMKGIFEDTNLYLLCVTLFVSSIHLLFDFLALKNDIYFWKGRSDLTGLSGRAMLWHAFSQIAVFLYLLDEKTSMLVLVPSFLSSLLEIWKAHKVIELVPGRTVWGIPFYSFKLRSSSQKEALTQKLDAEAMRYLTYVLYPLCVGWAVYSLLYEPHKGWYSWTINSVVHGVYAFGFLFMLPQLFINYRLKSVAHMPWRSFMYKAFNTFIDDLFAFIITMPTVHRVACFRDDVVFIIYLYQRWLYPVDKSRRDGHVTFDDNETPVLTNKSISDGTMQLKSDRKKTN